MAKRGSTRPWRVRFEWENGVTDTDTKTSRGDAEALRDLVLRTAEQRQLHVTVEISHRDRPKESEISKR